MSRTTAISVSSRSSVACMPWASRWNTAGTTSPIALRSSIVLPRPAAVRLKRWTGCFNPPTSAARAEDEQHVADDRPGERCLDQVDVALAQCQRADDQLGGVAERRVEQAADPAAEAASQRLGGPPDRRRERQDRGDRDEEHEGVALGPDVADDERQRNRSEEPAPGRHVDAIVSRTPPVRLRRARRATQRGSVWTRSSRRS